MGADHQGGKHQTRIIILANSIGRFSKKDEIRDRNGLGGWRGIGECEGNQIHCALPVSSKGRERGPVSGALLTDMAGVAPSPFGLARMLLVWR